MAWLVNPASGEREYLAERSLVGRSHQCWIRIGDASVSKEHAVIFFDSGSWVVKDLGSRNGTWANGSRLQAGSSQTLGRESRLRFGDVDAVLAGSDPPTLCARSDSGSYEVARGGVLLLPDGESPQLSLIEVEAGKWVLERAGESERPLHDGDALYVGEERYHIHVPSLDARKAYQATLQSSEQLLLCDLCLELAVSSDGESIATRLRNGERLLDVPPRTAHQVLLVLAQQRLEDRNSGVDDSESGWVYSDDLARKMGYDRERMNVDIHRLRQQFAALGVLDAARLIERRPTSHQLRLGIERAEIA